MERRVNFAIVWTCAVQTCSPCASSALGSSAKSWTWRILGAMGCRGRLGKRWTESHQGSSYLENIWESILNPCQWIGLYVFSTWEQTACRWIKQWFSFDMDFGVSPNENYFLLTAVKLKASSFRKYSGLEVFDMCSVCHEKLFNCCVHKVC